MSDDIRSAVHKALTDRQKPGYVSSEQLEAIARQQRFEAEAEKNR